MHVASDLFFLKLKHTQYFIQRDIYGLGLDGLEL